MTVQRPRYVLLGNGSVAARFLECMVARGEAPEAVILNSPSKQRHADDIRGSAGGTPIRVWDDETRAWLEERLASGPPLWLLSVYFGHILAAALLEAAGGRAINLHPSLLPWGRGAHTNVWPIVEGTPAGVSLHVMAPRVDAGAVVKQEEVPVRPWDTAATLYERLSEAALRVLLAAWPDEVLARWPGTPQAAGGSERKVSDLAAIGEIDVGRDGEARRLFDLLRARSFPPYPGLRIRVDGAVVDAVIELREVADG